MNGTATRSIGGRYELEREIARGSTAVVWQARTLDTGAAVAVKVLRPELAADPALVGRFMAERSILMAVDHPNLVRVRDLVAGGEVLALVTDLVDGVSLRELSGRGPTAAVLAGRIAGQIAAGLCALHDAGIVHSDVKPENILIDGEQAKLADLGLAWLMRTSGQPDGYPAVRPLLGTPGYLAPELALGAAPAAAVDVYALGVVLYEILSGRRPRIIDEGRRGRRRPNTAEHRVIPDVPRDLWRVVGLCLRAEPTSRPTAAALADLLSVGGNLCSSLPAQRVRPSRHTRGDNTGSQSNDATATQSNDAMPVVLPAIAEDASPEDPATRPTIHRAALVPAERVTPDVRRPARRILIAAAGAALIGCLAVVAIGMRSPAPASNGIPIVAAAAQPAQSFGGAEPYEAPTGWLCRSPAAISAGTSIMEVQPCLAVDHTAARAMVRSGPAVASLPSGKAIRVTLRLVDLAESITPLAEQTCDLASSATPICPEISVASVPGTAYRAVATVATSDGISGSFAKPSTLATPIVQNSPAQDRHSARTS